MEQDTDFRSAQPVDGTAMHSEKLGSDLEKGLLPVSSSPSTPNTSYSAGSKTAVFLVSSQIICEVFKQLSVYSLQYYNGGAYPVPKTLMVVLAESLKLAAIAVRLKTPVLPPSRSSLRFILPGLLYALNSLIYLTGLTLVTPTIWLILTSARTVLTAIVYKFILWRPINFMQFLGVCLIMFSIFLLKLPDLLGASDSSINALPVTALYLAIIASGISVSAAVYSEVLFKNARKDESFMEQQFWLYFYGTIISFALYLTGRIIHIDDQTAKKVELGPFLGCLLTLSVCLDAVGGLIVASILRYLDNIVKERNT